MKSAYATESHVSPFGPTVVDLPFVFPCLASYMLRDVRFPPSDFPLVLFSFILRQNLHLQLSLHSVSKGLSPTVDAKCQDGRVCG